MKLPAAAVRAQRLLPKTLIAAAVYRIARSRRGWLKNALIRWFIRQFRVAMGEAALTRPEDYASFNDFFTRALKTGARPLGGGEDRIVSPVDGVLMQFGRLVDGELLQAKGMTYSVEDLLDERGAAAEIYREGSFANIYLAPPYYHRVHMPVAACLTRTRYVPGERFSVNAATSRVIEGLFRRNERVVCHFETPTGPLALVLVGALNVASISTVADGEIASGAARQWHHDPPLPLGRGEEIGRFNLGSTVIVLFPPGVAAWDAALDPGRLLMMGEAIGTYDASAAAGASADAAP